MTAHDELLPLATPETEPVTPAIEAPPRPRSLRAFWDWAWEMARFLVVGGVSFVVDMGLFNLLVFGPGQVMGHRTTTANVISITVATLVSWVGNRHWTFSSKRTDRQGRELVIYAAINVVAALVPVGTVALTRYTFHLDTALALNAAKVAGIVLGTAIRYAGYKLWVFTGTGTKADESAETAISQV